MICLRDGLRQDILVTTSHLRIIQYHRMSKEISLFIRSSPHRNPLQHSSLAPLLAPVRLSPPSEGPIFICLRADLRQDILVVTSHLGIIQQHRSCPLLAPVRLSPPSEVLVFICLRDDLRQDILVVTSHLNIIQQHRTCPLLAPVRLSPPSEGSGEVPAGLGSPPSEGPGEVLTSHSPLAESQLQTSLSHHVVSSGRGAPRRHQKPHQG